MLYSHKINELNKKLVGKKVVLTGWVDTIRAHGNVIFLDLRDRNGKVQAVIHKSKKGFDEASSLSVESCIKIDGEVKARPKGSENVDLGEAGKVEIGITILLSRNAKRSISVNIDHIADSTDTTIPCIFTYENG